MLKQYILAFLISMVPLIELRGGVPAAMTMGISAPVAIAVCAIGNMLPVPFIYLFARKVLIWGSTKPVIGSLFTKILDKGEKAGQKLVATASRKGLFIALLLFVGILQSAEGIGAAVVLVIGCPAVVGLEEIVSLLPL